MSKRREQKNGSKYISKSKIFLLPMLECKLHHINDKINYLIDVNFTQTGFPQIVLIFDNIDYEPLKADAHRLSMLSEYVAAEFGDEDKEIILFFDVPKKWRKDFELFVMGAYSEFSKEYKDLLVGVYGNLRSDGFSSTTGLPKVSIYDAIYPLKETKRLFCEILKTDVKIKEVLDPPKLEEEEFKEI